ncbi:hypothetical protein PCE1_002211 [Barthelona sp. PCE]
MRVLICTDSFKDTLDASSVGKCIEKTIQNFEEQDGSNEVICEVIPLSDGGEGFLGAFREVLNFKTGKFMVTHPAHPFCDEVNAAYGYTEGEHSIACVEFAEAAGLELVPIERRNPLKTTAVGVGQLLKHIELTHSPEIIYMGIGGSSTNEAGISILQGLGAIITMSDGTNLSRPLTGGDLFNIMGIDMSPIEFSTPIALCCDVNNPFCGENGAVAVFSPQKGAKTFEMRSELEFGMINVASLLSISCDQPCFGASGGVPGGLSALLKDKLNIKSGIEFLFSMIGIEEKVANADMIITGEGSFDSQSIQGKVIGQLYQIVERVKGSTDMVRVICGKREPLDNFKNSHVVALSEHCELEDCFNKTEECIERVISLKTDLFNPYLH